MAPHRVDWLLIAWLVILLGYQISTCSSAGVNKLMSARITSDGHRERELVQGRGGRLRGGLSSGGNANYPRSLSRDSNNSTNNDGNHDALNGDGPSFAPTQNVSYSTIQIIC